MFPLLNIWIGSISFFVKMNSTLKGTLKIYWFEGGIADRAIKYHKKNWIMEIIVWKHFIDLSEFNKGIVVEKHWFRTYISQLKSWF